MKGMRRKMNAVVHWVGVDVSKGTFDAALLLDGVLGDERPLSDLPVRAFERSPEGVETFLGWLDERCDEADAPVRCVMETTGPYSVELAVWLLERRPALAPSVVHAKHAAEFIKSLGVRNHTDGLAARGLAFFGLQRQPDAYDPPSKKERELRELSRYRQGLVCQRTALKNQIEDGIGCRFVARDQEKYLRRFNNDIARVEGEMRRRIERMPEFHADVERLQTIFGVGFVTATVVQAELGDLSAFATARELSAHCGVNPCVRQSGTSVRGKTRMSKQGNSRVRHALYMAAKTAIRGDNDFADDYHGLVERGLAKKAALGAVMRKLLVVMRRLILHGETYDPHYKRRTRIDRGSGGKSSGFVPIGEVVKCVVQSVSP